MSQRGGLIIEIIVAKEYGFCDGVKKAIEIGKTARRDNSGDVNVLKQIVHNRHVVDCLGRQGIGSVDSLGEAESGTIVFGAHGVGPGVVEEAKRKGLNTVDSTCSFVTRVHRLVKRLAENGYAIILIGDKKHDEIIGVVAEAPESIRVISNKREEAKGLCIDSDKISVVTQTTLSVDDTKETVDLLRARFPSIKVYNSICLATQRRQEAVKELAKGVDLIIVVGETGGPNSRESANSRRLVEAANACGKVSYLVNDVREVNKQWFIGVNRMGVTAGASTPNTIMERVIGAIRLL